MRSHSPLTKLLPNQPHTHIPVVGPDVDDCGKGLAKKFYNDAVYSQLKAMHLQSHSRPSLTHPRSQWSRALSCCKSFVRSRSPSLAGRWAGGSLQRNSLTRRTRSKPKHRTSTVGVALHIGAVRTPESLQGEKGYDVSPFQGCPEGQMRLVPAPESSSDKVLDPRAASTSEPMATMWLGSTVLMN